jgi:hypothetical protein
MAHFKSILASTFVFFLMTGTLSTRSHLAFAAGGDQAANVDPDADYDRLDGAGKSGKKVDVIEWEDNLEIHVYPKGSTAGLGMKLDDTNKNKPVMVIAYRFVENPKTVLTRRAILGIPMVSNFKVYKDPMENDFDKFIISNNGLSGQVVSYRLDPTPTQLYPEGYAEAKARAQGGNTRAPASVQQDTPAGMGNSGSTNGPGAPQVDDNGTVGEFFSNDARGNSGGPGPGRRGN